MKRLFLILALVACLERSSYSQLTIGSVPLGQVVTMDCDTLSPTTGAMSAADSTPTIDVFEETTDTPIIAASNMTARTSYTGAYRVQFTASTGNGFEVGKIYVVKCKATVGGLTQFKTQLIFRVVATETTTGVPKVNPSVIDANAISDTSIATAAVTKIQTNLLTFPKNVAFTNYKFYLSKLGADYNSGSSSTITCEIAKDGGSLAACDSSSQSSITFVTKGIYKMNIAAADMNVNNSNWIRLYVPTDSQVSVWQQQLVPGH